MNTVQFPNTKQVEAQAAAWIAVIDRGASADEQLALDQWLEESPLHGESLIRCASMWDMLDILEPISKLLPIEEIQVDEITSLNDERAPRWKSAMAIAAGVMLLVGGGSYQLVVKNNALQEVPQSVASEMRVRPQVYQTEVGEISTVALSDGSLMQLNTDSQVEVRYSNTERNIKLLKGEAFFDVAKNASKPFVVESGSDRVTAIGTAFGVDTTKDTAIEVVVTEGRVKVNRHLDAKTPKYEDVYLTPGQKLVVRDDKTEVESDSDTESLLAWREGMVIFQGESLREVVAEIDRYTPLKFRLMDAEIASISVGGFFKTGDLDQLLLVLEQNFGVASQRQGDEILLLKANL